MAGRGDPPEGTPEGVPGGADDEYRSVVFDESFVRAARLQEFSAQERLADHSHPVRSRPAWSSAGRSKQALLLILLIFVAFGTAIYMGVRHPYQPPRLTSVDPLSMTVIPLAPKQPVPGAEPGRLYAHSPAAEYRSGAAGVTMPPTRRTEHFSEGQVVAALVTAKDYIVESSLDPDVLTGGAVRSVRLLLDPGQLEQFDRSFAHPRDDGQHSATGWVVRFDPAEVALADADVRVRGVLNVAEADDKALEVVADHTFVYAVRAAGDEEPDRASLFTVRRELHFRFDPEDLGMHRAELTSSVAQAGPEACADDPSGYLRPLLAGQTAESDGSAGTDPYATGRVTAALCGVMAPSVMPDPGRAEG
ncbi:hypothetical protein [Streptomyces sp. GC420]|uniref:SCO2583 family membrane protein n=1 Tax=Streptomyces sp. GC420 TaxID=2697568 RepID=UPI001414E671|nr:hypothetical protein [Streptomyces sp. GC420]NBM15753.1 hypothetical protein [Streptomyces sp. GC420]